MTQKVASPSFKAVKRGDSKTTKTRGVPLFMSTTALLLAVSLCVLQAIAGGIVTSAEANCGATSGDWDSSSCVVKESAYHCVAENIDALFPCPTSCGAPCDSGTYCPITWNYTEGASFSCPEGGFCMSNTSCVWACPSGHYCPRNTSMPIPCAAGQNCPAGNSAPPTNVFLDWCGKLLRTREPATHFIVVACTFALPVVVVCMFLGFLRIVVYFQHKRYTNQQTRDNARTDSSDSLLLTGTSHATQINGNATQIKVNRTSIGFFCHNLNLAIPSFCCCCGSPKEVLKSVSCIIPPGRFTAIMGGSGCGKTSLMSALRGHPSGKMTGICELNGYAWSEIDSRIIPYIGYVPQDDIMHSESTVKEVISFQARGRLDKHLTPEQVRSKVADVMNRLKVMPIQDSLIGDEKDKVISGGEKKRVNIAMELVADVSVLFLDEPTSGLDSTTSKKICALLEKCAKDDGVTVVAIIHQPRVEIFRLLENLLLLGNKGEVVYSGKANLALAFFAKFGFVKTDTEQNPADFLMDVLAGQITSSTGRNLQAVVTETTRLFTEAMETYRHPKREYLERLRRGFFWQTFMYFRRTFILTYLRHIARSIVELLITAGGSAMLSFCLPSKSMLDMQNQFALGGLLLVLFCHLAAMPTFGPEEAIARREFNAGFYKSSYFMGKDIATLLKVALIPLIFSVIQYAFIAPKCALLDFLLTALGLGYASFGSGMLLSAALPQATAQMTAILGGFIFLILSGFDPSLTTVYGYFQWEAFGNWVLPGKLVTGLSPIRWSFDLLSSEEYVHSSEFWRFCASTKMWSSGFDPYDGTFSSNTHWKMYALFSLGVFYRILCFFVILTKK